MKCRICHSDRTEYAFAAQNTHGRHAIDSETRFPVHFCLDCGAYFLEELPLDKNYYEDHYPESYHEDLSSQGAAGRVVRFLMRRSFRSKAREILRFAPRKTAPLDILDVGCGTGEFLENLDRGRFAGKGIERHPTAFQACKKKRLDVCCQALEESPEAPDAFDVVTLWHVLEHLKDPAASITRIKRCLRPNGLLVISVPNTDSLGFRLGGDQWFHLDAPRHLTWFNLKSLKALLGPQGFDVVKAWHIWYEYPLDLFWSLRRSPARFFVYPFYPIFKIFSKDVLIVFAKKRTS